MQIRLGTYNGRKNVAYKSINWDTGALINTDVYGEFDLKNPFFTLDTDYNVNYGYFVYEGKTYYGYVNKSVHTNGFYVYTFSIDYLATVAHGGCLNSMQFSLFGPRGRSSGSTHETVPNQCELDPRLKLSNTPTVVTSGINANFGHDPDDLRIIIVTSQPLIGDSAMYVTPGVGCYALTPQAFTTFVTKLGQAGTLSSDDPLSAFIPDFQQKLMQSIINVYAMPTGLIPTGITHSSDVVTLSMIDDTVLGMGTAIRTYDIHVSCQSISANNAVDVQGRTYDVNVSGLSPFNPSTRHGSGTITIPDAGTLSVEPTMLSQSGISSVGYAAYVDFVGGKCSYYLRVNGSLVREEYFTSDFPCLVPLASFDYNLTNLIPQLTQGFSSAMGASKVLGGFGAGLALGHDIIANSGQSTVTGKTGGSTTLTSKQQAFFKFVYFEELRNSDFTSYYGKPTNQMVNLSWASEVNSGKGYVQTQNCDLPCKGFPQWVIDEANRIMDSGAFIGISNAPTD